MTKHIVIGTAGHIDHGKSALIKSLTGTDPDRLKEEKERGMTTDLGFAFYGSDVTIIDVPGHEKFVRHMLAGASTIDFVMLVIAADDGVMPQTIEHLDILKLLELKKGIIVVTKIDLVDGEHLKTSIESIKELVKGTFLENAPIIPVSNATGAGMGDLKKLLDELIVETKTKQDRGIFRMPIDRCFTIKGFGTVIAGTVLSGKTALGETVELLPQKKKLKVRGIEVHNQKVNEVTTGYRAAINIVGAEKEEIERGNVIAQPGFFESSEFLNASLYVLRSAGQPLKSFTRVRIHLGTAELLGRVVILEKKLLMPGEKAMIQFRLESPAVCDTGDRYVIRTYSPQVTIGGGVIIEARAEKVKGFDEHLIEHLQKIETRDPLVMVEEDLVSNFDLPRKIEEIARDVNLPSLNIQEIVRELTNKNLVVTIDGKRGFYYSQKNYSRLCETILRNLKEYHKTNPTHVGMPRLQLATSISRGLDNTLFNFALDRLVQNQKIKITEDGKIGLWEFDVALDKDLKVIVDRLEKIFLSTGFQPPDYDSLLAHQAGSAELLKKAYRYLIDSGTLIFLGEGIAMHKTKVAEAKEKIKKFLSNKKEIRVSEFRDLIDASRKYALPLLIYFDTKGITIKRGDVRILGTA